MVAPKNGSVKMVVALFAGLGFVVACASTVPDPNPDPMPVAELVDVVVESGDESSAVTLLGLVDPVYTATYDEELQAVVVELTSVDARMRMDRVEVYDDVINHVSTSTWSEEGGEPITRVEIALGAKVDYETLMTAGGLVVELFEPAASEQRDAGTGDLWEVTADLLVEEGADAADEGQWESIAPKAPLAAKIETLPPPAASLLLAVEVQSLGQGSLVHLQANGSIGATESFVLENPDRLVVDLPGLTNAVKVGSVPVDDAMVKGVRIGAHPDKVRVVIDGGSASGGFAGRSIKPSADGLFVAVGSGEEVEKRLSNAIESAATTWNDSLAKATPAQNESTEEPAAGHAVATDEWTEHAVTEDAVIEDAVARVDSPSAWESDAEYADEAAEAEAVVINEVEPVSSNTSIHGVHYTVMDELDRIAVLSEEVVDYRVHSPDPDTLVVSLFDASIAPQVAGRIRGQVGGPVSLVTIFEQPEVAGSEVRVVVTRAPDQEPLISRRGSLLFIDFQHLGVAAAQPPAFPDGESAGLTLAESDEPVSTLDPVELPQETVPLAEVETDASEEASQLVDALASLPGPLDDLEDIEQDTVTAAVGGPASLEPPAAVEVLQEGGLPDGKKYTGRRISLDFKNVPISDVLRLIAEVSDLNLVAGDEVKGAVTIRLVDTPWDQALDVVLLTKGLGFVRVGNILRVAPADILAAEEELRLQERRNREKLEDLMVKLVPVNYAAVKDMSSLVKRLLSSRGTVNIDQRTNTLILKDIASVIDEAVALVKAVDTETPQVMIEAKIVEANLNFSRELGSSWSLGSQPLVDPFSGAVLRDDLGGSDFRFHGSNSVAFSNPITSAPTALADLGAFLLDEKLDLNVALRAAESMGEGKVISSPRVVTLDNGEATIEQGVSIPFQTFEGGDAKLEFIDAVLSLKVVPHITADRSIIMDIEVTRNAPDDSVPTPTGSPAIAKAEASTETLVKDGQTLVLGGIYTIDKTERESRVPYLHRLPVIGAAFRSKELTDIRKELLIFVTPRIVKSPSLAASN